MTPDEFQTELFKVKLQQARSELREQEHKEAKAAAEARTARAAAAAAEHTAAEMGVRKANPS